MVEKKLIFPKPLQKELIAKLKKGHISIIKFIDDSTIVITDILDSSGNPFKDMEVTFVNNIVNNTEATYNLLELRTTVDWTEITKHVNLSNLLIVIQDYVEYWYAEGRIKG